MRKKAKEKTQIGDHALLRESLTAFCFHLRYSTMLQQTIQRNCNLEPSESHPLVLRMKDNTALPQLDVKESIIERCTGGTLLMESFKILKRA